MSRRRDYHRPCDVIAARVTCFAVRHLASRPTRRTERQMVRRCLPPPRASHQPHGASHQPHGASHQPPAARLAYCAWCWAVTGGASLRQGLRLDLRPDLRLGIRQDLWQDLCPAARGSRRPPFCNMYIIYSNKVSELKIWMTSSNVIATSLYTQVLTKANKITKLTLQTCWCLRHPRIILIGWGHRDHSPD